MLAGLLAMGSLTPAMALPDGGTLVSGSAAYETSGNQLVINQHSEKLITHWNDFSIGADQSVTFDQPGPDAIALNRVTGFRTSNIQGALNANGQVFLINPNGVLIGQGAQVNVAGLVASTRDLSDKDFNEGRYRFSGNSALEVVNDGKITTTEGGYVALLGTRVRNDGTIVADQGSIALGAGNDFTLSLGDDDLINLQVQGATLDALVQNTALLKADGGQVLLVAKSANAITQTVVNNQGLIEANTLASKGGRIVLEGGEQGVVRVGGQLSAKAAGVEGDGGSVETLGANTRVELNAQVDTHSRNGKTGTWVIESNDLKVGSTGVAGSSTLMDSTLVQSLKHTSVHLRSRIGDVSMNAPITWSNGNQLALSAARDLRLNQPINASGADTRLELSAGNSIQLDGQLTLSGANSSLGLNYGNRFALGSQGLVTLSGREAGFDANGRQHKVIQNSQQLQAIGNKLDDDYVLGNQIKGSWSIKPIGGDQLFSGSLNGLGNTLSGFTVNGSDRYTGLFGQSSGSISNLKLASVTVNGTNASSVSSHIGGLVGRNSGSISNVSATGMRVSASGNQSNKVGGLVGVNMGGAISDAAISGVLYGGQLTSAIGGLVGENSFGVGKAGTVTRSSSDVNVTTHLHQQAMGGAGGLVGINHGGVISDSSSKGAIGTYRSRYAGLNLGGLVGNNRNGTISGSSSSVAVSGSRGSLAGGLVGLNQAGNVRDSSASGNVYGHGTESVGGLVGLNQSQSTLTNVKATGKVIDSLGNHLGGLVGKNHDSTISGFVEARGAVQGGNGSNVGGLVGTNVDGFIFDATAYGAVEGHANSRVGGLIGYNDGNLLSVEAHGKVSGHDYSAVGGLVGLNAGYVAHVIERALATGNVHGTWRSRVGGLVGENQSLIINSASRGRVSGGWRATLGGLVGVNEGDIRGSSATGKVATTWGYFQTYGNQVGVNHGTYSPAHAPSSLKPLATLME